MLLSQQDIMEEISLACVQAISARAGFSCEHVRKDRDSVDCIIRGRLDVTEPWQIEHPELNLQVKATTRPTAAGDAIAFDLPMKNYDDLRAQATHSPRLLVVLAMPADPDQWLSVTEEQLVARRCCHWCNLKGEPPVTNTSKRRVRVPRRNVLTPESMAELMEKVSRRDEIGVTL